MRFHTFSHFQKAEKVKLWFALAWAGLYSYNLNKIMMTHVGRGLPSFFTTYLVTSLQQPSGWQSASYYTFQRWENWSSEGLRLRSFSRPLSLWRAELEFELGSSGLPCIFHAHSTVLHWLSKAPRLYWELCSPTSLSRGYMGRQLGVFHLHVRSGWSVMALPWVM